MRAFLVLLMLSFLVWLVEPIMKLATIRFEPDVGILTASIVVLMIIITSQLAAKYVRRLLDLYNQTKSSPTHRTRSWPNGSWEATT